MIKGILLVANLWYYLRISKMMNVLCSKLPIITKVVYRFTWVPDYFAEHEFFNFFFCFVVVFFVRSIFVFM